MSSCAVRSQHVGVCQLLRLSGQRRCPVGVGNGFGFVSRFFAVRRCQMPLRLFEPILGLGADTLAMSGGIVGDLAQPGVRRGQRRAHDWTARRPPAPGRLIRSGRIGYGGQMHVADSHDLIQVHGARENNLKNVSVEIPTRSPFRPVISRPVYFADGVVTNASFRLETVARRPIALLVSIVSSL